MSTHTRIHTGDSWPDLYLMTAAQIAEQIGGKWDDGELADQHPWLVMIDHGYGEAWAMGIDTDSLGDMIGRLERLRSELAARG